MMRYHNTVYDDNHRRIGTSENGLFRSSYTDRNTGCRTNDWKETWHMILVLIQLIMMMPKVYEMIGQGKTEGMFQLESAGMKSFMKELKPTNLEDVIAGISLYRPGPMDFIPKYIKGKQ